MSTEYKLYLEPYWLTILSQMEKTEDIRICKNGVAFMKPGDIIVYGDGTRTIRVRITNIRRYKSFAYYFHRYSDSHCVPGMCCTKCAIKMYRSMYSRREERKYGMVRILFDILPGEPVYQL